MGIWADLREHSLSRSDKMNAGARQPKCTEAANGHRRVLGARCFVIQYYIF